MATTVTAQSVDAQRPQSGGLRFLRSVLSMLLANCRAPETGHPPLGMHVSRRGWKRNSALLLSLYDRQR